MNPTNLQPDYDQIPESDHAEFGGRVAVPRPSVFDGHDVHEMENDFHCQKTSQEPNSIG